MKGSESTEQVMAGMLQSFMDKDKRKFNIVVYNLPESPDADISARNQHDVATFVSIVKECLRLDVRVTKSFRAGKINSEKPRTLVLTLDDMGTKVQILEKAYKLSHSSKWRRIYIAPDRTLKEREEHKKLRDELKRRKEEGEGNITIRKGKVVKTTEPETVDANGSGDSSTSTQPEKPGSAPKVKNTPTPSPAQKEGDRRFHQAEISGRPAKSAMTKS